MTRTNHAYAARLDSFFSRLLLRAATFDEILSDHFETLPGERKDTEVASHRLSAWCKVCAGGNWDIFDRRLARDGYSINHVLARFAKVRRKADASIPVWVRDAIWVDAALRQDTSTVINAQAGDNPVAFQDLLDPVVVKADALLTRAVETRALRTLTPSARASLRASLFRTLSDLCAPILYEQFVGSLNLRAATQPRSNNRTRRIRYQAFVANMKSGGFRRVFEEKPILLRLIATLVRQWVDGSAELLMRLGSDLPSIYSDLLCRQVISRVVAIDSGQSDPHNAGRSVCILRFEDGARVVYKPKHLHVDAAWHGLVSRLNCSGAPTTLKAMRVLTREGYGWTEFIEHLGCRDTVGCEEYYERAGAWLALLQCFAGSDVHQDNIIAVGEHPVPIDLEMLLQSRIAELTADDPDATAWDVAAAKVAASVMQVGLLPSFGRSQKGRIIAVGGLGGDPRPESKIEWNHTNSDAMHPIKRTRLNPVQSNLPHLSGQYARLGDHLLQFIMGFERYARFLSERGHNFDTRDLFHDFVGLTVRHVARPTRFYYMLLMRLTDPRNMDDGIKWSIQADFPSRLCDWDRIDPLWPLQKAERMALLSLNIPHFVSTSDDQTIRDPSGELVRLRKPSGLDRARAIVANLDDREISRQVEIIRLHTTLQPRSDGQPRPPSYRRPTLMLTRDLLIGEVDKIAHELAERAIRHGNSAAWIGLDWLQDSEFSRLIPIGVDLYGGSTGIALFLAAHAWVTGDCSSADLAIAGILPLRQGLHGRNAGRIARTLGLGAATGIGSIVYALSLMSKWLSDVELLADATAAAEMINEDLLAADDHLDLLGGTAGAILSLLSLYDMTGSRDLLARAVLCGEYLLMQPRIKNGEQRSWVAEGSGEKPLNGMSHGASGFALALGALVAATGREEFACAAWECMAYENASYDHAHSNWPDFRTEREGALPCQWCHGAPGIGLSRIRIKTLRVFQDSALNSDIYKAVRGVQKSTTTRPWDNLCCGSMGIIEFLYETGRVLGSKRNTKNAERRLLEVIALSKTTGSYRWSAGHTGVNLGLFRGLSGVGYTLLRRVDARLPNILVWEPCSSIT
jgi:type 2 lantibiotic biosynthesis protein LanM